MDIDLLHGMLGVLKNCLEVTKEKEDRKRVSELGLYISVTFSAGLRGNELMNLSLAGVLAHNNEAAEMGCVMLSLLGNFNGLNYHLIPIAGVNVTGINNRYWMEKFISIKQEEGETKGWAFKNSVGEKIKQADFSEDFFELLEGIQETTTLLEDTVEIREVYGLSRSLRRGSNTHAHNQGVSEPRIELNNRWRKFFDAGGKRPSMGMRDSYIQIKQALPVLLKYSALL